MGLAKGGLYGETGNGRTVPPHAFQAACTVRQAGAIPLISQNIETMYSKP